MPIEFKHNGLEELYVTGKTRRIDPQLHRKIRVILTVLGSASSLADAASLTGFHPLFGPLKGHYAVTVTGNWRVTFKFENGRTTNVDYLDYH